MNDALLSTALSSLIGNKGRGLGTVFGFNRKAVPPVITRNAVNLFGPGHSTGTGILTSTGVTVSTSGTFVNNSGAPITVASLVFAGWILTSTGTSNVGNDVPVTSDIEYPIGVTHNTMLQSGGSTISITNGTSIKTDDVTLTTPIPAGASFKVNISATQTAGQFYIGTVASTTGHSFGLCGVNTSALRSTLKKEMVFAVGDSIMTNNGGALASVATFLNCPSHHMSIAGTTAQSYGASTAANFTKQVALATLLGATRFLCNFGTNDFAGNRTVAQLNGDLGAMRTRANAAGIPFTQTTITPRTTLTTTTASVMTSAANVISMTVPDASKFVVGNPYTIAGANEAGYNGDRVCLTVDTGANILTFPCQSALTSPATGTLTIKPRNWSSRELQVPVTHFEAGSSSWRGQFNAGVRAGTYDGYIDWGDACEFVRDDGLWAVGSQKTALRDPQTKAVVSGTPLTNTRFQTSYTGGSVTMANGFAQFMSGANIGETHTASSNSNGDYTSAAAFANIPVVGDGVYFCTGVTSPSDDGLHGRVAVNSIGNANYAGGQALIVNATVAWLQGLLA